MAATVYLSLGSNTGDRARALRRALALLEAPDVRILRVSSIWETAPVPLRAQPWFLNLVAEAATVLFPRQLLARARKVESLLGRTRLGRGGPRSIDIDILLYGGAVLATDELRIPHPRLCERRFVLEPLAELAPQLRHPVTGRRVADLVLATRGQAALRRPDSASVAPSHI